MRNRVSKLLSTAATSILLAAANASISHANELNQWTSWVEVGGFGGSDNASRGELVGFMPLVQTSDQILFTELRGKAFEQDQQEGNFALGYRQMLSNGWNAGIWAGVDVRRTPTNTNFWQAAGGLELLHPDWDVRLNGYLPFNKEEVVAHTQTVTPATSVLNTIGGLSIQHLPGSITTSTVRELALWGIDGEVGARVPLEALGLDKSHELRLFAGAFRFDHDRLAEDIAGPRVRSEWRIADTFGLIPGSRLTFETEYSSDTVRDHRWEAGARLRIPLTFGNADTDRSSLSAQAARMTEALERDTDIVTSADTSTQVQVTSSAASNTTMTENVIDNATNVTLTHTAIATDAATLAAAVAQGEGTLIIVDGAGGVLYDLTATSGQALGEKQTIVGGSGTLTLRGAITGTLITYTAPGTRPILYSADSNAGTGVLTLHNSNHVTGLNLEGAYAFSSRITGNKAIHIENRTNVVVQNNHLSYLGHNAIEVLGTSSNIQISDNTIVAVRDVAVEIAQTNGDITVHNNNIRVFDAAIRFISSSASNVMISDNRMSNAAQRGTGVILGDLTGANITVNGNSFTNLDDGIFLGYTIPTNTTLSNNQFANMGDDAFEFFSSSGGSITAGSTGNQVTVGSGNLCHSTVAGTFVGTYQITDSSNTLRTFTNGCP